MNITDASCALNTICARVLPTPGAGHGNRRPQLTAAAWTAAQEGEVLDAIAVEKILVKLEQLGDFHQ